MNQATLIRLEFLNPLADRDYRLGVRAGKAGKITTLLFLIDTIGPAITELKQVLDGSATRLAQDSMPSFVWKSSDPSGVRFHHVNIQSKRLVDGEVPGTPELVTPVDGLVRASSAPTLVWKTVADDTSVNTGGIVYILEIGTGDQPATGDFANPVVRKAVPGALGAC